MTYVDNTFESPAIISFCPGILGIERGLERAGTKCRVAAYVEIEAFICANLVAGMEAGILDPAPIWTDAKTFDARPFRGKVHGIIGGYPCPGESLAGLREGHLYHGFLWPALRRAIAAARPLFCFFENVDDHLTGTYPIVQRSLRNMGYAVEAGIYTANEAGAPHERKRIFILAIANSVTTGLQKHRSGRQEWRSPITLQSASIRQKNGQAYTEGIGAIGKELAHPEGIGKRGKVGNFSETDGRSYSKLLIESDRSSEEVGHSEKQRSQKYGVVANEVAKEESKQWRRWLESGTSGTGSTKWPAGQGLYQYGWEEPRTIESGMGCTVNGYNFKEDLLRALGNSVVEQTAEIAWIDLMNKHFKR